MKKTEYTKEDIEELRRQAAKSGLYVSDSGLIAFDKAVKAELKKRS